MGFDDMGGAVVFFENHIAAGAVPDWRASWRAVLEVGGAVRKRCIMEATDMEHNKVVGREGLEEVGQFGARM